MKNGFYNLIIDISEKRQTMYKINLSRKNGSTQSGTVVKMSDQIKNAK